MVDVTLKVDFNLLELDDLVAIEEGDQSARFVRSILARFMIDPETGTYYTEDKAIKAAGKLSVETAKIAVENFAEQVRELKDKKLPPTNGGN